MRLRHMVFPVVIFVLLVNIAEAQQSGIPTNRIEQGRQIHWRILDKHPQIDEFYRKPFLFGILTDNPLAVISIPTEDWVAMAESERTLLSEYAASLVGEIKADPFTYSRIPSTAPIAQRVRDNASRMTQDSWGIMAGRITESGSDIYSDKVVLSGKPLKR